MGVIEGVYNAKAGHTVAENGVNLVDIAGNFPRKSHAARRRNTLTQ